MQRRARSRAHEAFAPLAIAISMAGCSFDFEPYEVQDYCTCIEADGGTAWVYNGYVACNEREDPPGRLSTHVCLAAADLSDAGCTAHPECVCRTNTMRLFCD